MSGVPAGQLYIDIIANVAKLQQDMERVKRSVGDMSSSVATKSRAANDNLSSLGNSARDAAKAFDVLFQAWDAKAANDAQKFYNAALGIDAVGKSARDSARAFEELYAEQDRVLLQQRKLHGEYVNLAGAEASAANAARMLEATYRGTAAESGHVAKSAAESASAFAALAPGMNRVNGESRKLEGNLFDLARAEEAATRGAKLIEATYRGTALEMGRVTKSARDSALAFEIGKVGGESKLAAHHAQNLAFQFQDLGVQMAMAAGSSHPLRMGLMALIQQGAQIRGIMTQAELSVAGLAKEAGRMSAKFAPAIAGIAAASIVFKQYLDLINEGANTDAFVQSLGLTKDELKELGDTSVSVGDLMLGTWDVIADGLWKVIGPAVTDANKSFQEWFWESDKAGRESMNDMIAVFVGGFNAIKAVWGMLPAALSDLFVQSVNAGIQAINSLIRTSVQGVNDFITQANTVLGKVGVALPKIGTPELSQIVNANAGAAAKVSDTWRTEMEKARKDYVGTFGRAVADAAIQRRNSRLRGKANEIIEDRPDGRKGGGDRRAEALAREAEATEAMIRGLYRLADAYGVSEAAALKEQIVTKATQEAISKGADVASYVDRQLRLALAQKTADAAKDVAAMRAQTEAQAKLNARISEGGMTYEQAAQMMKDEAALRPYLAALALKEGEAKDKLAETIRQLRDEQKKSNDELALTKAIQDSQDYQRNVIAPLEREAQVLGLVGWAREKALLELEREAEINPLVVQQLDALARGNYELAAAIGERIAQINKGYAIKTQTGDSTDAEEKAREELERYNDSLRETIDLLQQIGGLGNVLAGAIGIFSGNTRSVGGALGAFLNIQTGESRVDPSDPTKKVAETIGDKFSDALNKMFNGEGSAYFKTFSSLLQGAGNGLGVATAVFGKQNTAESIGAALGGAAGKAIGTAIGGPLGGAIGSALGGIAGSLLGGLVGGTKKGSATIGNVNGALGVSGTAGNSNSRIAAATKSANAIIDSLTSIADQLGATLDPSKGSVSIGIRKGSFRVDPTGRGATKVKKGAIDFGEDAEAAAYYAMMDLIKDGVLTGLRAGTERLLKNADDLEAGLAKALTFENVFKDLKQRLDPLGFAFDEIGREAEKLQKIFAEAGATAEEYAQLEQLLQLKREDAIEQARQEALSKISERRDLEIRILELLGRQEDALAASREMELEKLKDSLKPLQAMIYTLEDARAIIDQFGPLAADLRAFKQELLGSQTANSFAAIAKQFREVSALAKGGDADALGKLRGSASEFLDAAKENARTSLDYRRAVGEVLASVDSGIFAADTQVEYAQMQIDAIAAQTDILVSIREELDKQNAVIAANTAKIASTLQRFEGDGMPLRPEPDTPLYIRLPDGEVLQVEVAP